MGVRGPAGVPSLSKRSKILIGVGVAILVLLVVGPRLVGITTDWLWFSDLGYTGVYSTILWTRVVIFLVTWAVVAAAVFGAIYLAYRERPAFVPTSGPNDPLARYRATIAGRSLWFGLAPALIIGLLAGLVTQASWATVQTFLNGEAFGITDPQYGMDIGFYAFDLPFYQFLLNLAFVIAVIAFLANLLTHYVYGGVRMGGGGRKAGISTPARIQLAALAALFLILKAVGYWFDRYSLLSSDRKNELFTGASYTDINAVLPSKLILMAIAIICAAAFISAIFLRDLRVPALATVLMVVSAILIGAAWPAVMEQFSVRPNAAEKEAEYIQRNMDATQQAYKIVAEENVLYERGWNPADADPADVNADDATLSNIRLLDPNVIGPAFTQRQRLKNFYGFPEMLAIDRYTVDGEQRDYIVAARELDPSQYNEDQQNWINKHTVYTHGNGFVAAPANQVDSIAEDAGSDRGGLPAFEVADIGNYQSERYQETANIPVTQPRIYFGPMIANVDPDYAIVGSDGGDPREYDIDGQFYTYTADSGVDVGGVFRQLLYSIRYTERNFLLSDALNSESRILYNRDPRDRVEQVAPWLTVDSKTYPAVMDDGSIKWIVDGYTTLDNFPYAQRMSLQEATQDAQELNQGQTGRQQINETVAYVRNSVKATVDAYTGEVELYQFDDTDPVLKTWMNVFPGTVNERSVLDEKQDLLSHVRYPEDLFKIQRELLSRYHVDNPGTFFQGNNFWSIPDDPTRSQAAERGLSQPPYYFTAADPQDVDGAPEFQLTTVMNILDQKPLAAYMTASSDPENYGRITVKTLPTDSQTVGPQQAYENMLSDGRVASDRRQVEGTTQVTYGNLLTLPVGGDGLLYIEPMYTQLQADTAVPKLYKVLVYYNGRVGYESSVGAALRSVGIDPSAVTPPADGDTEIEEPEAEAEEGTPRPAAATPDTNGERSPEHEAAVREIGDSVENLRQAQGSGDLGAIGDAINRLDEAVKKYEQLPGN